MSSEDMLMHFSSNSNQSDPSLPTKLAKLEARMAGKGSTATSTPGQSSPWSQSASSAKFGGSGEEYQEPSTSSDSDDDVGGEFLIQANIQKRQKLREEDDTTAHRSEGADGGRIQTTETADAEVVTDDVRKRKYGRSRARPGTGRRRGSRANEQAPSHLVSPSNGHPLNSVHKESWSNEQVGKDDRASLLEEVTGLRRKVASLEEELCKARQEASHHQEQCQLLEKELGDLKEKEQHMKAKVVAFLYYPRIKVLSDLLISVSKAERQEARTKMRQDSLRLGNVGVIRAGTVISESWEDGQALRELNAHLKYLLESKESIEKHRKSLKKRQSDKGDGSDHEIGIPEEDFLVQDEICKTRLASIKREEDIALRERDRYELEKGRFIREMKRIRDEDGSRFNNFQVLNHRYALLNLLGKGGFSEVYKAYDLVEYRYVACKLHGLNAQWSEEKKQSYIRHAIREYNIHKTLVHHNIVRLWDTFEIDQNTFCTVLEYCSGKDLDAVLKTTPVLPEKEARIIIIQIFQGLVYMNKRPQKIIHYDLKPGNVLFNEVGIAKVTDFGLSKIVDDDVGSQGMELTSQGAGTYWYLPPECFELSKTPLISSKERILREDTIIRARKVEFPSRPSVSNEAKDLIRRCLTYNQADRPEVLTIAQDPYLSYSKR
ncbi:hypothetical protein ACLOJK_005685 [Asimina triloba]